MESKSKFVWDVLEIKMCFNDNTNLKVLFTDKIRNVQKMLNDIIAKMQTFSC